YNEQTTGVAEAYGYIINQANVSEQLIDVYEGTFIGYDPAQGDDKKGSGSPQSFLVKGSTSTESEDSEGTWVVKHKY
ncbi:hypothetical protein, partial [Candidatus Methanarcanum hacksteinii]|uniref:hypothetical protein n=1 Tax=Candidatus Methanarcanum hacksteinii TaxID=2911857 RepID=UPI0037DD67C2